MIDALDAKVSYIVNVVWSNGFLDAVMPVMTQTGTGEAIFILAVILFPFMWKKDRGRVCLILLAGLALTYYVVSFIKPAMARPRPYMVLPDIKAMVQEKSFSFPSHHSAQAFMAATVLSAFFRRFRALLFVVAGLVAFSRIYLGVHYLSDVAAGAVIGMLVGLAVLTLGRSPDS